MKSSFVRPALVFALALGLTACGGKASFTINGTVDKVSYPGVIYPGLVLTSNGMDLAVLPNATSFSFPNSISYGDVYNVQPKVQPQHQLCKVVNGQDTAGRMAAINVTLQCTVNRFTIGGSVTGLSSAGLVLTNGSSGGTVTVDPAAPAFTFSANTIEYGTSYGVTVLTQPANNTCSVSQNGTGVMGDAAVNDIVVTCGPKA